MVNLIDKLISIKKGSALTVTVYGKKTVVNKAVECSRHDWTGRKFACVLILYGLPRPKYDRLIQRLYRVYLLTFKSFSQSCGGLHGKQFAIGHLWSKETGTNLKLVQKVREETRVSMHKRAGLTRRGAAFRVRRE